MTETVETVLYHCDKDGLSIVQESRDGETWTGYQSTRAGRESFLLADIPPPICDECKRRGFGQ